ncbi:MAG: lipopolysaccharide heptosyltransferase II [Deltaproteobacteria bacterium]|nr:lipopolysaccharide heptosyltransferase II [Deltaproteobacteria bacterium]
MPKSDIKSILVRVPNWIGDAVLCLPAIEKIKSIYPQAEITVLAKPWVSPVFFNNPVVKRIIDYDASGRHNGIAGKWRLIQELKQHGFDMAVLFQNAFEAALIAFLARISIRVGYARDLRGWLLTHSLKLGSDIKKAHQVFYYLNIAASLSQGYQPSVISHQPKIYLTTEEKIWAEKFLNDKDVDNGIIVGMAPGASYGPAKRWMAEKFSKVAGRLTNDYGAKLVVFGGKEDREICNAVLNGLPGINLAGELDLRKSIAIVSKCNLFLTNDSGPMHISASLGIPTIAMFGSTDPKLTGPLGGRAKTIKKDIECSPCFERVCKYGHYNCFNMVTEDDVYGASVKFLQEFENV